MRRLVKWALVTLGIVAIVRRLRRRRAEAKPAPHTVGAADPADELRRKLAESRTADEAAEPPPPSAAPVEERRAEVHAEGRAAVDEMRSSDES